jgi:D-lactate dehydrogenase
VAADVAILPQGANTSLTGASVARDTLCDRPTVVVNMRRLSKILPIGDGAQVLCFSGAGIYDLKEVLEKRHNRDSHSVLGSLFLNPSVGAGIAYGSGGTQIRKGPAWTERALYCKVTANGEVELVNTLGLKNAGDVLSFLEGKEELAKDDLDPKSRTAASWPNYGANVRKLNGEVSRYNADTTGIDCCRSEGKVMILASIHDTFAKPKRSELVWVSCRDLSAAHALKREVALKAETCMAQSCEYMNNEVVNGVDRAGRILIKMIELVGMQRLEPLWNLKLAIEATGLPFSGIVCDKFLWWFNGIIPRPLPPALRDLCQEFDHHLLVEMAEYSEGEVDRLRGALDGFVASRPEGHVKYHVCADASERSRATLFRFVVAPAFRTFAVGSGMQGLSIDYALPKRFTEYPDLPEKQYPIVNRWVYSHFGCNVYHEDLVFDNDVDVEEAKHEIKHAVEHAGGRLPAEHGHGTEYKAPKETQERWKKMDPLNVMNPGVGGTSNYKSYSDVAAHLR